MPTQKAIDNLDLFVKRIRTGGVLPEENIMQIDSSREVGPQEAALLYQAELDRNEINRLRPFTSEEIEFLYNQLDNERNEENDNDFFWRLYEKLSLMRDEGPPEGGKR